jgi:hypothetical protein
MEGTARVIFSGIQHWNSDLPAYQEGRPEVHVHCCCIDMQTAHSPSGCHGYPDLNIQWLPALWLGAPMSVFRQFEARPVFHPRGEITRTFLWHVTRPWPWQEADKSGAVTCGE